jgi:hypothetical protein
MSSITYQDKNYRLIGVLAHFLLSRTDQIAGLFKEEHGIFNPLAHGTKVQPLSERPYYKVIR